jgi:hypothetical protein
MIDFLQRMFAIWIIAKTIVAKKITANAAQKIAENITRPTRCGGRSSGWDGAQDYYLASRAS